MDVEKMADAVFKGVEDRIGKALGPILARLDALEAADPIKELLAGDQIKTLVDLEVSAHFEANPVQHGQDGAPGTDGKDGERGPQGEKGQDGKDGVGLAGALIDRNGELVVTMTDGREKHLGVVVGKDGEHGLSYESATGEYDAERGFVVRLKGAGREAEFVLPYMVHRGFWTEGTGVKAGQSITHDGALWIAKRDTAAKPCLEKSDDWQLAARKGRDGRDGKDFRPAQPVALR